MAGCGAEEVRLVGAHEGRGCLFTVQSLSGRNRTSDPVIADIYSHMLYQLSYAEATAWAPELSVVRWPSGLRRYVQVEPGFGGANGDTFTIRRVILCVGV